MVVSFKGSGSCIVFVAVVMQREKIRLFNDASISKMICVKHNTCTCIQCT